MSSNSNGNIGDETQAVDGANSSTPGGTGTANNQSNTSYHTNNNNNSIQSQHTMNTQQLLQQLPTSQENISNSLLPHLFGTNKYDSFVDDNADNVNYLNALYANSSTGNGEDMDFPLFLWDMDEGTGASTGGTTGTGGRSTPAAAPQATTNHGSGSDSISTMSKLLPSQSSSNSGNNQAAQSQSQLQVGNPLNTNNNSSMNMNLLNFNMNVPQSQSGVATNFSAQSFVNDLASQLASAAGGAGTGTNTSCGNPLANASALQPLHQFNLGNFQLTFDNSNLQQQQHPGGVLATAPALQQGGCNNAAASAANSLFGLQGNTAQPPWNNVRAAAGTNSAAGSSNNNNNSTSSIPQHHHFVNQIAILPKVNNRAPGSSSSGHSSTANNNFQQQQQQQQNNINQLLGSLNPQIMNSLGFSQNGNNSGGPSNNFNQQQQQQQEQDQVQKFQLLQQQLYNQGNLMFPPPPQQHQQQQQQFQIRMTSSSSNQQQQNSNNQNAFIPSDANNQQGTTTSSSVPGKQQSHQQQKQQRAGTNTTTTSSSSKKRKLGDNESLQIPTTTHGSTTTVSNNHKTHAVVSCSDTDGEQVTTTHTTTIRSSNASNAVATNKKQRNVAAVSSASGSRSGIINNGNNIATKESSISSISSNSRHSDPKAAKATDNGNNNSSSGGGEEEDESNIPSLTKFEDDLMSEEEKAQANRLRNREHARNTRARKKAYLESLKSTLDELCKERDTLVSERAGAASLLLEMQKTRTDVLLSFFALRSSYEKRRHTWSSILDESIMCVMPVTPYRSFLASEVQISRCQRNVMGIDGVINDTASLHVLLNSLVDRSKNPNAVMKFRYTLVAEDAVVSGNQMMARWSMSTENAVELGAKREVTKAGMLCAKFSSAHKIVHLELMFDVMAFMLQLKQSSGVRTFTMVPNTVQTCAGQFRDKPMVMTLAERPYTITQVNTAWEQMTSWTGDEVVGKQSCKILQGDDTEGNAVEALMCHVRYQRPASASFINYDRHGHKFRQFINVYPLSTDSKITHYFALTVYYEKIESSKESEAASKPIQNTKNDDVVSKEESSTT